MAEAAAEVAAVAAAGAGAADAVAAGAAAPDVVVTDVTGLDAAALNVSEGAAAADAEAVHEDDLTRAGEGVVGACEVCAEGGIDARH